MDKENPWHPKELNHETEGDTTGRLEPLSRTADGGGHRLYHPFPRAFGARRCLFRSAAMRQHRSGYVPLPERHRPVVCLGEAAVGEPFLPSEAATPLSGMARSVVDLLSATLQL